MDLLDSGKRERRQSFVLAFVAAIMISVMLAPTVEAAIQRVKVRGAVKVKDTTGDAVESEAIGQAGLPAPTGGSSGALAVRTFAGGNQFLGAADCDAADPAAGDIFGNTLNVPGGHMVTGLIITGEADIVVTSQAIGSGQVPLLTFQTTAQNPNEILTLDNGLELTDNLRLTCTSGEAQFVAIGQDISG